MTVQQFSLAWKTCNDEEFTESRLHYFSVIIKFTVFSSHERKNEFEVGKCAFEKSLISLDLLDLSDIFK